MNFRGSPPWAPWWLRAMAALGLAMAIASPSSAWAYEFEVHAQTIGQGASLRSFRLLGTDIVLDQRRITQTLSLSIWDIGGRQADARPYDVDRGGPRVSFSSYLRVDHDFGSWSSGSLLAESRRFDAVDLIPELETRLLALDVLYAYVAAEELAGGNIDIHLGRLLEIDALDWWSVDGASVRIQAPGHVAITAMGGLRVRDSSPVATADFEPDGTSGAECAEYVEGSIPGSGAWRPIDREVPTSNDRFANELDRCPQREQLMPAVGGAIETHGLDWVWARLSYRRSMSPTPGLIGPVDRFENPDTGLYPNELGQAPSWGVNEERVAASVRANRRFAGGRGQISPYAAARWSLLHGAIDEAHAGVRVRRGAHSIEPELYYSLPTFDGDSIFNIFSSQPYVDIRMTYDLAPAGSPLGGYARAWLRRFATEDQAPAGGEGDLAAGVHLGARYLVRRQLAGRLDLFHEDGYGGRRTGGYVSATWQATELTGLRTRLSLVDSATDAESGPIRGHQTSFGLQAGASYQMAPGIVLHALVEDNLSPWSGNQLRLLGMADFAFFPDV